MSVVQLRERVRLHVADGLPARVRGDAVVHAALHDVARAVDGAHLVHFAARGIRDEDRALHVRVRARGAREADGGSKQSQDPGHIKAAAI